MSRLNPTVRGLAIVVAVAALITAAGAEEGLTWVFVALQALFVIAIGYALYRLWRNNRQEIAVWPVRARLVVYGAAVLAFADIALSLVPPVDYPEGGLESLVFFVVLGASAFAMWRVWRDQHTYGY
jgi:hypothetical protein